MARRTFHVYTFYLSFARFVVFTTSARIVGDDVETLMHLGHTYVYIVANE